MASRSRGSVRAAYQARDSALFTIRSESNIDNLDINQASVLARTFVDPQFSAVASLYDQVQLTGVQVKLNITGVTTGEAGVASSVPMVVAWDRDSQVAKDLTYDDVVNYSSARTYQLGNLTSGKIISSTLYPTTMGEKSEMWSTDKIMNIRKNDNQDWPSLEEQYKSLLDNFSVLGGQWNPVLIVAVPSPAKFSAKVSVIATLRCRGVRFQKRWLGMNS